MDTGTHYQKYWSKKKKLELFSFYERNWVLPALFEPKEKVLDLGCGDGAVSEYLQDMGVKVTAIDISEEAVRIARRRGVDAKVVDIEKGLPYKDEQFDAVFWGDNVEHLFDPEESLKEIHRVLKTKGRLVLSCPNMGYWRYRIHYFLKGTLPDTEWTGNPPWAWSHIRFFNTKTIQDFLKAGRFRVEKIIGVSRRFPDVFSAPKNPSLFGMILVVEAQKR